MDVAVHPSHSDNGGSTPESLLLGVPTVATNVGGFPDIVRPGRTGWLAPARNPEGLAEQIGLALTDKATVREYAKAGREHVKNLLDVRRNAREVVEAYTSVLTRASARSVLSPTLIP
jgi:glycosyltransferase involved in cell wall biosynthesis